MVGGQGAAHRGLETIVRTTERRAVRHPAVAAFAGVAVVGVLVAGMSAQASRAGSSTQRLTAQPVADCVVRALPTLGGADGAVVDASSTDVLTGWASDGAGVARPVVWESGMPRPIRTGLEGAVPTAVNDDGVVVGSGYDVRADRSVGWVWSQGKLQRLDRGRGAAVMPEAITSEGRIVGAVEIGEDEQATVWPDLGSPPVLLPPLPGDQGAHAFAAAPDGSVGGVSLGEGGTPVVWQEGKPRRLGSPTGYGMVLGFDQLSRPVGVVYLDDGESRAVTWAADGQALNLGTLRRGGSSTAVDRLGGGDVVGTAGGGPLAATRPQAMLWQSDQEGRLLEPVDRVGFDGVAATVNGAAPDGGRTLVVGYSEDRKGQRVPTEWRCP